MKPQSVFIPVPVEENEIKMEAEKRFPEQLDVWKGIPRKQRKNQKIFTEGAKWYQSKLEKKENIFVLTKEELEKVFNEGREWGDIGADNPTGWTYKDFNDWLNQQST